SRCVVMTSDVPLKVWLVTLPDDLPASARSACLTLLDAAERERAERFRVATARDQYIAAHALTRLALSVAAPHTAPAAWVFERGPAGKPFVAGGPSFSLSHTSGMVGCAVAARGDIGFDLEAWDRTVDLASMAAVLTEDEAACLSGLDGPIQRRRFYELWTAKEACAKACGRGIAVGLRDIRLHGPADDRRASGAAGEWCLTQEPVGEKHLFALATAKAATPVVHQLSLASLADAAVGGQLVP
ncbi:MAG: 4-phosphopantetheinyl transferase superfamily protein, partial [Phycisphaerales bacterium]|nr:4-phosphopantetheinyl transferase superfamily protein [Phycisphaerales bacterium]